MEGSSTSNPSPDRRWQELCSHVHITDDISFKLLALVPLVSIAGIATSLFKGEAKFVPVVAVLSLFAAAVTRALWIWERRNLQTCEWLRDRAADFEADVFHLDTLKKAGHFYAFPTKPGKQGKSEAEKLVYGLTISAWLLLPAAIFVSQDLKEASQTAWFGAVVYALVAGWVGLQARRTLCEPIDFKPTFPVVRSTED